MLFAMLASRGIALARMGRYEESAQWAVKAAARPNAHMHIHPVAAYSLALADSLAEARVHAATMRRMAPDYSVTDFLSAYQFDANGVERFRRAAEYLGMV